MNNEIDTNIWCCFQIIFEFDLRIKLYVRKGFKNIHLSKQLVISTGCRKSLFLEIKDKFGAAVFLAYYRSYGKGRSSYLQVNHSKFVGTLYMVVNNNRVLISVQN